MCLLFVSLVKCSIVHCLQLNDIETLREYLESISGKKLTNKKHMAQLFSVICEMEEKRVKDMVGDNPFSIIFDGRSWLGELLSVGIR